MKHSICEGDGEEVGLPGMLHPRNPLLHGAAGTGTQRWHSSVNIPTGKSG